MRQNQESNDEAEHLFAHEPLTINKCWFFINQKEDPKEWILIIDMNDEQ